MPCLETKIPIQRIKSNVKPKATAFDKKRMEMIKELIRLPFSDHKKPLLNSSFRSSGTKTQ
jgi:hypothetical protein